MVIEPQFDQAGDFVQHSTIAVVKVGDYYGCIDRNGEFVVEPRFDEIDNEFYGGLAFARMGATRFQRDPDDISVELEGGRYTYINDQGKVISLDGFEYDIDQIPILNHECDGIVEVQERGKWGCIDKNGKYVIPLQYEMLGTHREGLFPFLQVQGETETWGVLNSQAEVVVQPRFDFIGYFCEGLASFSLDNRYGYINASGEIVIEAVFEDATEFSEGLAGVKLNGLWGYIDRTGKLMIPNKFKGLDSGSLFAGIKDFHNGLVCIDDDGNQGLLMSNGDWFVTPEFFYLGEFDGDVFEVEI